MAGQELALDQMTCVSVASGEVVIEVVKKSRQQGVNANKAIAPLLRHCRHGMDGGFQGMDDVNAMLATDGDGDIAHEFWEASDGGCFQLLDTPHVPSNRVDVPYRVYKLDDRTTLESVELPNGLESIGPCAFKNCTGLVSVVFPAGLKSIDAYAFQGCRALKSVELPDGLESIGPYAFERCSALKSVELPDGLASISPHAFERPLADLSGARPAARAPPTPTPAPAPAPRTRTNFLGYFDAHGRCHANPERCD